MNELCNSTLSTLNLSTSQYYSFPVYYTDYKPFTIDNMSLKNTDDKSTELCIKVKKHKLKLNFEL